MDMRQDAATLQIKDVRHIKRVFGSKRGVDGARWTLTEEEIAEVGHVQVTLGSEPMQYRCHECPPDCQWQRLLVVVDTEASLRGAQLVDGFQDSPPHHPCVALDTHAYQQQQLVIKQNAGECSPGCCAENVRLDVVEAPHGLITRFVCRHTLRPCISCASSAADRAANLELLLSQCRVLEPELVIYPHSTDNIAKLDVICETIARIDAGKPVPVPDLSRLVARCVSEVPGQDQSGEQS